MLRRCLLWLCALVAGCGASVAGAQAPPEISLITFGPGEIYWQRFGHNALLVREPSRDAALVYNYGIFDFEQKNFFLNFMRGRMRYRIAAEPLAGALRPYAYEGRWAVQQRLDLRPGQARELRDFLRWNLRPENVEYHYDYFVANCSTKVRDALDGVLDGAIRRQLEAQPAGTSYRRAVLGLTHEAPALQLGIDLGLGPAADRPINRWQEAFVPMRFMEALRGIRLDDGRGGSRPLVIEERPLLPGGVALARPPLRGPGWLAGGAGVLLAALLAASFGLRRHRAARCAFAALSTGLALVGGLAGLVLLLMWTATDHWPTWRNLNLLLLNPLSLALLPTWVAAGFSGWHPSRRCAWLAGLIAVAALCAGALALSPWAPQCNLHWCLLLAPPHAALWACAVRRRRLAA